MEVSQNIGGYRLLAPLGAGGMGTVWKALDGAGNVVALKLLNASTAADLDSRRRLAREAATINRVRSEAVAQVLDVETEGQDAFIVTEYIEGPTLYEDVASAGPWEGTDLADLGERLAAALAQMHQVGVIHRDIKPSNIMVSERGPVLIDFGIAQLAGDDRITSTGLVTGTPGYLAPWIISGDQPDKNSDWWSWAAVILFAATGRPPFGRGTLPTVLMRVQAGTPDVGGLVPALADAFRRALSPDPMRLSSPTELVETLNQVVQNPDAHPTAILGVPAPGGYPPPVYPPTTNAVAGDAVLAEDSDGNATEVLENAGNPGRADYLGRAGFGEGATSVLGAAVEPDATEVLGGAGSLASSAPPMPVTVPVPETKAYPVGQVGGRGVLGHNGVFLDAQNTEVLPNAPLRGQGTMPPTYPRATPPGGSQGVSTPDYPRGSVSPHGVGNPQLDPFSQNAIPGAEPAAYQPAIVKWHPVLGLITALLGGTIVARVGIQAALVLAIVWAICGAIGKTRQRIIGYRINRGGPGAGDIVRATLSFPIDLVSSFLIYSAQVGVAMLALYVATNFSGDTDPATMWNWNTAAPPLLVWALAIGGTVLSWLAPGMGDARFAGRALIDALVPPLPGRILAGLGMLAAAAALALPLLRLFVG
ncbi:MAG: serine/threonine-protein kinase [Actinomycetaceae bacterium]|nr:serine/threonine-protein kinase [Actinomycetaceae bacterium]